MTDLLSHHHSPTSTSTDDIWSADPATHVVPPTDIPNEDAPPHIFGDLAILDPLSPGSTPPPFVTKDHFNSLLLLSRLLKTHDKLTSVDIKMMQELDQHFRDVIKNINKH